MKNKLTAALLTIILVIAAAGCAASAPASGQDTQGALLVQDQANIATMGEEYVPVLMYGYFFALYHANLLQHAMMTGQASDMEAFWNLEQDGLTVRQLLLDRSMESAKEYSWFYRLGFALGITESEEQAEIAQEQIALLLEQLEGGEEEFIETYRMTPEQMREAMRRVNVAVGYITEVREAIEVTEEAIREAQDADPDPQVTVRHVLIGVNDDMSEDERAAATALAQEILERINGGEAISELAVRYSEDPGVVENQGEYTFGRGVMVHEFEEWAFDSVPGDTGIVLTHFGYHVMQRMDLDTSRLEEQARTRIFEENHQYIYDLIDSDNWVYDHELINAFIASI